MDHFQRRLKQLKGNPKNINKEDFLWWLKPGDVKAGYYQLTAIMRMTTFYHE
jgi:hypothetical protein